MKQIAWSEEEIDVLKNNYGKVKIEQIELLLPNRTRNAIWTRARIIGVKGNHSIANRIYTFNKSILL